MANSLDNKLVFYKPDGKVNGELYDTVAQDIAKSLIENTGRSPIGVSRHQLRRLFEETKRLKRQLEGTNVTWDDVYPLVKLLKSKTSYAVSRAIKNSMKDEKYYRYLKNFIHSGIDKVQTENDYEVFCNLFEAVYGFYYEMGGANTK